MKTPDSVKNHDTIKSRPVPKLPITNLRRRDQHSPALSLDQFTGVAFTCDLPSAKNNPGGSLFDQCVLKFTGTPAILLSTRSSLASSLRKLQ